MDVIDDSPDTSPTLIIKAADLEQTVYYESSDQKHTQNPGYVVDSEVQQMLNDLENSLQNASFSGFAHTTNTTTTAIANTTATVVENIVQGGKIDPGAVSDHKSVHDQKSIEVIKGHISESNSPLFQQVLDVAAALDKIQLRPVIKEIPLEISDLENIDTSLSPVSRVILDHHHHHESTNTSSADSAAKNHHPLSPQTRSPKRTLAPHFTTIPQVPVPPPDSRLDQTIEAYVEYDLRADNDAFQAWLAYKKEQQHLEQREHHQKVQFSSSVGSSYSNSHRGGNHRPKSPSTFQLLSAAGKSPTKNEQKVFEELPIEKLKELTPEELAHLPGPLLTAILVKLKNEKARADWLTKKNEQKRLELQRLEKRQKADRKRAEELEKNKAKIDSKSRENFDHWLREKEDSRNKKREQQLLEKEEREKEQACKEELSRQEYNRWKREQSKRAVGKREEDDDGFVNSKPWVSILPEEEEKQHRIESHLKWKQEKKALINIDANNFNTIIRPAIVNTNLHLKQTKASSSRSHNKTSNGSKHRPPFRFYARPNSPVRESFYPSPKTLKREKAKEAARLKAESNGQMNDCLILSPPHLYKDHSLYSKTAPDYMRKYRVLVANGGEGLTDSALN